MNEKKIYQEFCWDLTKKYLDELSGNGEKDDYIYEIRPTEKIAIGILDSGINNDEATRYTSMPMIKVQFYVDSHEAGELSLILKGNLYYNVLPTYQEQLAYAKKCEDIIKKQDLTGLEEEEQKVFYQNEFLPKFKRVKIDSIIKDIIINKKELMNNGKVDFSSQINDKLFSSIDLSDAVFYNERNIIKDALESEEKYNKYLRTISYNILGNNQDVAECINDVLMKVWNAIPPKRPQNLKAYVGRMCRNHSINRLRNEDAQKRGGGEVSLVLDELQDCISLNGKDELMLDEILIRDILNDFLKSISEEERNIFICRYWYFDSISDISKYAGCSESRIKSILFRNRKRLKKFFEKEGYYVC